MRLRLLCCVSLLILVAGCMSPVPFPTSTPTVSIPTRTLAVDATFTPGPPPTNTREPTATPEPISTPTAIPTPTVPPPPPEWIALYGAGSESVPLLYALAGDGSSHHLELNVYRGAAVSGSGRWIASPGTSPPAASITIIDLQGGTTYTIDATDEWGIRRMTFDRAEARLAFLELGSARIHPIPWAIGVVNLADGSAVRFEGTTRPEEGVYPGNPLAWTFGDHELLLGTFLPYSDGFYAGVQALEMPPGTLPAPVDALKRRTLIPGGEYRSVPRLSSDGTRLLYLARDPDYVPADYDPALDFAVNQLWTLDIASATPRLLYQVTNGNALGGDAIGGSAAWMPDGERILFAQGHYAGMNWGSLALQVRDVAGNIEELASLPLPEEGAGLNMAWCMPDMALAVLTGGPDETKLYTVNTGTGELNLLTSAETVFVLGCIETP